MTMILRDDLAVCVLAGALCMTVVSGCASQSPLVLPPVAVPGTPLNEEEALIAKALSRALIEEKDLPGYDTLSTSDTLIVMCEYRSGQAIHKFGPGALPHSSQLNLILLTSDEVNRLSAQRYVTYLSVEILDMAADSAAIEVDLAHSYSHNSLIPRSNTVEVYDPVDDRFVLRRADIASRGAFGSSGYILSYRRVDDRWQFVRVVGEVDRN